MKNWKRAISFKQHMTFSCGWTFQRIHQKIVRNSKQVWEFLCMIPNPGGRGGSLGNSPSNFMLVQHHLYLSLSFLFSMSDFACVQSLCSNSSILIIFLFCFAFWNTYFLCTLWDHGFPLYWNLSEFLDQGSPEEGEGEAKQTWDKYSSLYGPVHCALCTLHCAPYTLNSAQCTLYSALWTVHSALCTAKLYNFVLFHLMHGHVI